MTKAASPPRHPSTQSLALYEEVRQDDDTAWEDAAEARVIAANKDFYRKISDRYERYESCTFDVYLQNILEKDLDKIRAWFTSLGRTPRCLDCGGGTGNLALKLLALGWEVTVVDVSDEMLSVLKKKARAGGHSPRLIHSSIECFLRETSDAYDLVAFSSVLHHLYSYTSIVQLAAATVCPEGIFYSNYDPVVPQSPFWTRAYDTLDITVAKALFDRSDFLPGIGRRCLKAFTRTDPLFRRKLVSNADLAEYHAHSGVDDEEVIKLLRINGFAIVEHLRYPAGRTRAIRFLNKRLRLLESFKIIARRDQNWSGRLNHCG